jgi:aromatic-L-amino-acid decarboxylase
VLTELSYRFRKAGYAAIDSVCDYFDSIENGSIDNVLPDVEPGDVGKMISKEAPEQGEPWSNIEADFHKIIMPG